MAPGRVSLLAAALAAASLGQAQEIPGCFYHPFAAPTIADPYAHGIYRYYDDSVTAPSATVPNATSCQQLCQQQGNCTVFTFFDNSKACWLQTKDATFNITLGVFYGGDTTAGPKVCEKVAPRCKAVVGKGFPGTLSQAFPTDYQPRKGVCWKKTDRTKDFPAYEPCAPTEVLQKITGCTFPDSVPIPASTLAIEKRTCREVCDASADCAAWEMTELGCYTGVGHNCTIVTAGLGKNASGERLGRGVTRAMHSWSGAQFVAGAVMKEGFVSIQQFVKIMDVSPTADLEVAADDCRDICASVVNCEFWQLDKQAGCFIDTSGPNNGLAYPLVAANFKEGVPSVVAGEYIQHLCGVSAAAPGPAPTAAPVAPVPPKQALARITLEFQNLDYAAILPSQLATLRLDYAAAVAAWVGVPATSVLAMDGTQGVTLGSSPWSVSKVNEKYRLLQTRSAVSTFLDAHIKVPVGQTIASVVSKVVSDAKLFTNLQDATVRVLGADSAAVVPPGVRVMPREVSPPREVTTKASAFPWWGWVLIAIGGALIGGACIGIAVISGLCDSKKKKSKSRRKMDAVAEETAAGTVTPLMAMDA